MRLNHDCIRDLLLGLEENLNYNQSMKRGKFISMSNLSEYDKNESIYTLKKMVEAGYIQATFPNNIDFVIEDITYSGHQFLDNIRDPEIWSKTKVAASKVAGVSLSVIGELASSFVRQSIGLN
ncbi:DUF2513 domain-containing protein [Bacillus altitudinis MN12]|uniref:DUF2513 domain-containing protein n=1 Tax=Bacillus altitudinis TaxID=293387 RepID=UPI001B8321CD|nr:DUF2513 domain-containing protein [Bacillus altitudinis]MCA1014044.1 DUF2513 domain-containing protein [Bacillus stratosphericus]MBR0583994.1 DUF2513 domain-containing protein [Bacillus altitudinis MN12]MBR0594128.1 DUF2513 domain-containing protein [Bacillus altitudinis C16B11]MBR0611111.1 DUF2513 domain-containing protein [Bacillus altitudinis]MCA2385322.1 DUF2513 domain-containing protein [Bacillus stratosphericus]